MLRQVFKMKKCHQSVKSFAFFDLETTGLPAHEYNKTKITEICLVASSKENILRTHKNQLPRVLHKLSFCVNPFKQISGESTRITGLDNFLLENENKFDENFVQLLKHFILQLPQPVCLVAHNGDKFDFPIIQKQLQSLGMTLPDDLRCLDSLPFFRSYEDYLQQEKLDEPKPLGSEGEVEKESNDTAPLNVNTIKDVVTQEFPCGQTTPSNGLSIKHDNILPKLSLTTDIVAIAPSNIAPVENELLQPDMTEFTSNIMDINTALEAEDVKEKQKINESTPSNRKIVMKKEFLAKNVINHASSITPPSKRQLFTPEHSRTLESPSKRMKFTLTAVHERFFGQEPNKCHYAEGDTIALMKCVVASKMEFFEYAEQNARFCSALFDTKSIIVAEANIVKYDQHKFYQIYMNTDDHTRLRRELEQHIILDHYSSPTTSNITLLVAPDKDLKFSKILKNNNIQHDLRDINFQSVIDEESANIKSVNISASDFGWKNFYRLQSIYAWLDYLVDEYDELITPLNAGESYENRALKGVKLSYKTGNTAVFIEAGIHAKEWISPAVATFILNQLLTSTDPTVRDIAESFDWIVFPVFNPDGYEYTFEIDRLWRKNREPFGSCFGVDLNRNWDSFWGTINENSEPCGNNHPGPYAFSSPETRNFANFLRSNVATQHIRTYLSFHSAAQKLLFPYSALATNPPNNEDLKSIGEKGISALKLRYGTKFEVGSAYQTIYGASGTSTDWVFTELGVPIAFTYELRRSNHTPACLDYQCSDSEFQKRFLLPVDEIESACWETLDSVIALLNESRLRGYYKLPNSRLFVYFAAGISAAVLVILGLYIFLLRRRNNAVELKTIEYSRLRVNEV